MENFTCDPEAHGAWVRSLSWASALRFWNSWLVLTDASVEDEGVAQGDDDEGLNVTDGEHVDVRLGWPVVIVSPA
jgi:hypothetical protein